MLGVVSKRLTEQAHEVVAAAVRAGDTAVDATVGNGHDTLYLAKAVGASGAVFGFDIQPQALARAQQRLDAAAVGKSVTLFCASHADMHRFIPGHLHGRIAAVMFNLGYLPGGDHDVVTRASSTEAALSIAWSMLRPGGRLSVLAYRGHAGGADEASAVHGWLRTHVTRVRETESSGAAAPLLLWCER